MINAEYTYPKDKLTKWMLTISLFFSILSFSTYDGYSHTNQQQTTKTELVISSKGNICKWTVSYKSTIGLINTNSLLIWTIKNWSNTLSAYSIITKVRFDSISRQFCMNRSATRFIQIKTIPKSSEEELVSLIG
jgi:hypothetical protein